MALITFLVAWFQRVYQKNSRKNLVNNLLNAEQKYGESSQNDETNS